LYGVAFGVHAGGMMILATGLGDEWPEQAASVLDTAIMTTITIHDIIIHDC
jgi:hypothetical protein